jgi:hypothetical protein
VTGRPLNGRNAPAAAVQEYAGMYRRYQGFGEPVPVPDDLTASDRETAVALSGRDPYWRA